MAANHDATKGGDFLSRERLVDIVLTDARLAQDRVLQLIELSVEQYQKLVLLASGRTRLRR